MHLKLALLHLKCTLQSLLRAYKIGHTQKTEKLEKSSKIRDNPGKSALAELRSATGCFETVFLEVFRQFDQ